MSYFTCAPRGRVDSRLLVVGSQTASLTPSLSFCHNLCCRCPNGSCEAIFDIYTSIAFQWHKERFKARCFNPCNRTLKFQESRRTPKSPFRECECHLHILPKVGLRQPTSMRSWGGTLTIAKTSPCNGRGFSRWVCKAISTIAKFNLGQGCWGGLDDGWNLSLHHDPLSLL